MDFSKLRPKGDEEPREVVDLNRLVENLGAGYQESFAEGGISLVLDLKADVPIRGNGGQCYSLLQNLLLNARDAILAKREQGVPHCSADQAPGERRGTVASMSPAPQPSPPLGTIRIATSSGDGEVVLSVCDDGVGIPPEHMERIFEPFFSTKPSQGMGLGLNECRRIVELHGGEIEVSSEAGQGTTLTVRWPASPEVVT
jgi:signal transduction histidine kinase